MTQEELEKTIKSQKLPSDGLDNFWINLTGMVMEIMLVSIFSFTTLISPPQDRSTLPLLILSIIFLTISLTKKLFEKRLKKIVTNLPKEKNKKLIQKLVKLNKSYKIQSSENDCFYIDISSWANFGHTLVLIPQKGFIYFNLRFNGSSRGRPQYNFGQRLFNKWNIKRQIKKLLITQV